MKNQSFKSVIASIGKTERDKAIVNGHKMTRFVYSNGGRVFASKCKRCGDRIYIVVHGDDRFEFHGLKRDWGKCGVKDELLDGLLGKRGVSKPKPKSRQTSSRVR